MSIVTLRPATMADADLLLAWRNDPLTRKWSRNTNVVELEPHHLWLASVLHSATQQLYIALNAHGEPVGNGRLDFYEDMVEINVTVAPEHRGKGNGSAIVRALHALAIEHGRSDLRALVKPANLPSLISFLQAGFVPVDPLRFVMLKPGGNE